MAKQTFTTGQVLTAAQMTSLQQTAMLGGAASAKVASYVLVAADAGDAITMSNAGATTITANTGLFATGDIVTIINIGTGVCTITAGTATVTTSGSLVLAQNQGGVLRFTSPSAAIFLQFATPASGDIEGVTVTSPITGGGTSGSVGIAYDYAAGSKITTQAQTGTTYTFVLADADQKLVTASNAAAQTYSIPTNANVAFAIGTVINIIQIDAGQVTINAVTPGTTTVLSNGGTAASPKLRVQYSAASLIKVATDAWYVVGDIS
jgi:hypothetical protein